MFIAKAIAERSELLNDPLLLISVGRDGLIIVLVAHRGNRTGYNLKFAASKTPAVSTWA